MAKTEQKDFYTVVSAIVQYIEEADRKAENSDKFHTVIKERDVFSENSK
ncbi:MAG: hypothetical protein FWC91_00450 [Defluviitaleaceae bacterium]|nr:hypothetical protein [Defluviitaleaceae bacterium]